MAKDFIIPISKGSLINASNNEVPTGSFGSGKFATTDKGNAISCKGDTKLIYSEVTEIPGDFTAICAFKSNDKSGNDLSPFGSDGSSFQVFRIRNNNLNGYISASGDILSIVDTVVTTGEWVFAIIRRQGSIFSYTIDINKGFTIDNDESDKPIVFGELQLGTAVGDDFIGEIAIAELYQEYKSDEWLLNRYKDFLQSRPITYPITGFDYPKPEDTSYLKDGKLGDELITNIFTVNGIDTYTPIDKSNFFFEEFTGPASQATLYRAANLQQKVFYSFKINIEQISDFLWFKIGTNGNLNEEIVEEFTSVGEFTIIGEFDGTGTEYDNFGFRINAGMTFRATVTDFTIRQIQGILAHYNMKPINGILPDISRSGKDGTCFNVQTVKDGLYFNGKDANASLPNNTMLHGLTKATWNIRAYIISDGRLWGQSYNGNTFQINIVSSQIKTKVTASSDLVYLETVNNTWVTINLVLDENILTLYINGFYIDAITDASTLVVTADDRITFGTARDDNASTGFAKCIIADAQIHNYAWTPQEALAYHNSFRKPLLLEHFKTPVLNAPEQWEVVSGEVIIEERVEVLSNDTIVEYGEELADSYPYSILPKINGVSVTAVGGSTLNEIVDGNLKSSVGVASSGYVAPRWLIGDIKKYKLVFDIYAPSNIVDPRFYVKNISDGGAIEKSFGGELIRDSWNTVEVEMTTGDFYIQFYSNTLGDYVLFKNISLKEITTVSDKLTQLNIPQPIKRDENGLIPRFAKWVSNGVLSKQLDEAPQEWRLGIKYIASVVYYNIICNKSNPIDQNDFLGYNIFTSSNGRLYLSKRNNGSSDGLFNTDVDLLTLNTNYDIIVQRLKTEGVFPMIPTLHSELINAIAGGVPIFESTDKYSAYVNSTGSEISTFFGTGDEINYTIGDKILVEFNMDITLDAPISGAFRTYVGSNPSHSEIRQINNGKNSLIFTITATNTGAFVFTISPDMIFKMSALRISKIYSANTFATFYKERTAKTFELVPVVSGSNPVTDSTYTEGKYLTIDADQDDEVDYVEVYNQVKQ